MGELKKVNRIDNVDFGKYMTLPFKKTDEGFLTGRAIVTSVGVFTYLNADGTMFRELRLPEEVFNDESLNSMKLKPVANDHPAEIITAENAKVYQVGALGSNPSNWIDGWATKFPEEISRGMCGSDGFHVAIDMTITDAQTIADIEAGKTALSMGYKCDLEPAEPGATWCGITYDGIQRNIRYNHCAVVDKARAGDAARIRMDSADAVQINQSGASPKNIPEVNMGMKKITMDGVTYEGEEGLINAYQTQRKRGDDAESALEKVEKDLEKLEEEIQKLQAEVDDKKDRADKYEAEIKTLKESAMDQKRIDEAVKTKIILLDAASRAGVDLKEDMAEIDIKKAVITAIYPHVKLDGKDEVYISARYDAAVEDLDSLEEANVDANNRQVTSDGLPAISKSSGRQDSSAAYQRMVSRLVARSRGENTGG